MSSTHRTSGVEEEGISNENVYATPRQITNLEQCFFYHTMDIPGYGHVEGEWDLRGNVREYLGNVDFKGKRVLEIGVSSGFLSFYMESQGAEVVGFDLSEHQSWDIVPYAGWDYNKQVLEYKEGMRKTNNAFWLAHKAHDSSVRMVYGTVYAIPQEIGIVDISTFCSVLLHVRDPFWALQNALRLTRETVIVTDRVSDRYRIPLPKILKKLKVLRTMAARANLPLKVYTKIADSSMIFLPRHWEQRPFATWWHFNPEIIKRFIGVLGFEKTQVTYHFQNWKGEKVLLFTVVGHRTKPMEPTSMQFPSMAGRLLGD